MYFAVNPTSPAAFKTLTEALELSQQRAPELRIYALVDTAFDEALGKRLRRRYAGRLRQIYAETRLSELSDLSPCLIALNTDHEGARTLDELLTWCSGKPMLSFLSSALHLDAFNTHIAPLVEVTTEDGLRWPVRFADTRIIPGLLAILHDKQRAALLNPIGGWWIVDRTGEIASLPINPKGEMIMPWPNRELALDDAQFARLLTTSEPDTIIHSISTAVPEALAGKLPAEAYSVVRQHCTLADQHGITGSEDRVRLSLLGLTLPGAADREPIRGILPRAGRGEPLSALLDALPDEFWAVAHA